MEELVKEFDTNIETGLTDAQVQKRRRKWDIEEKAEYGVAFVRRNGSLVEVSPVDLVHGDIVEVKLKHPVPMGWWDNTGEHNDGYTGEKIPADIRIIESVGFKVGTMSQPKIFRLCIPDICHERHEYIRVNFFGQCKFLQI